MDINPRTDQSSEASVDHESSDRPPEIPNPSMPVAPDDAVRPGPAQQPPTRVFTLFKRLPAELRVLIWKSACAPAGPRIHFLEPTDYPDDDGRRFFWYRSRWREDHIPGSETTHRIHWKVAERTNDPILQWYGRELLSVCVEARRVFLDQKAAGLTSRRDQPRVKVSNMVQAADMICVRARVSTTPSFMWANPRQPWSIDIKGGFCQREERPSPRRLALELPVAADLQIGLFPKEKEFPLFVPDWLLKYHLRQKFMRFDRLDALYILDQQIKPRAHYDHHGEMPLSMYTEAFDGHHGSKFVAIDPEDQQAVQLWLIPEYCWSVLRAERLFPESRPAQRIGDGSIPKLKLRFLACVRRSSQTQQLDDGGHSPDFAFTQHSGLFEPREVHANHLADGGTH